MKKTLYSVNVPAGTYIGLDLATKSGFAVVQSDGATTQLVDYSSLSLPKSTTTERVVFTGRAVRAIMETYKDCNPVVVIEDCYLAKGKTQNPNTLKFLARLSGGAMFILGWEYNIKPVVLPALQIRCLAGVVGQCKGQEGKKKIVQYVNSLLREDLFKVVHHNCCDAILAALAGGKNIQ